MPTRVPPIARIRLARSFPRLLALPAAFIITGTALVAVAISIGTLPLLLTAGIGGLVGLAVGVARAAILLSVRVDVEESAVRLRSLGTDRAFALVPGPVTRVRLRGDQASGLRSATRWLGYDLGSARLRDEEDIEIVRLAPTDSVILIPTEDGRLALAAAEEHALLDALTRAARARQRLDAIVAPSQPASNEPAPVMTGIERALYERQQVEEREAAVSTSSTARASGQGQDDEDRTMSDVAAAAPVATDAVPLPEAGPTPEPKLPAPSSAAASQRRQLRVARPSWVRRPEPSVVLIVLPLATAGAAWAIGLARDTIPASGTDMGRLVALGLVLAGPGTTVGAILARIWWPRLVAVVVAGGIASAVFVGRSLLG
ncbi:MAG: hypothetical protein ABIO99_07550 [Candidatus Limnocylindria bacterium]